MSCPWMANCTFMRPTTPSSRASSMDCRSISATVSGARLNGGSAHAESPEWIPASSMCSITPATTTSLPSDTTSTSTSAASRRNRSTRTGFSWEACTASVR